jgi:uncharacterized protein YjbI with pentapeptide repeats
MSKEVRIRLTAAQQAKIKAATGKTMGEIRVSRLGKNLAVSPALALSAGDLKAQDLKAQDLKSQDLKSQDLKSQDLKSQDLKSQDLSAKDLKAT